MTGPQKSTCDNWFFEVCNVKPAFIVTFDGTNVLFGLTVTIGGGLAFATVAILVYFFRRMYIKKKAGIEFEKFLAQNRNSCSLCEDIVASIVCTTCNRIYCKTCSRFKKCKNNTRHTVQPLKKSDSTLDDKHYESFAHLATDIDD